MANITETLRIIIDADSKGAERAFGKVGSEATKELGKAENKVDRLSAKATSYGIAMAAAGAVAAGGFYQLAKSSEEAEAQNRKLDNSIQNSGQSFSDSGDKLRELANALQQKTAADADAIIGAESLLVQFGLTEDQVLSLTPLIVDLSRKMGVDLDTAAKAVAKSAGGNVTALRKMGVQVDATKAKVDPFAATVDALGVAAGGFATKEGKTFTGQLEILKNNLGDIGESVGKGAVDVFSGLAGGANAAAKGLNSINPAILESVGAIGSIASVAAIAGGSVLAVGGQFTKLRNTIAPVGEDGVRSFTKLGKAASAIAIVGAIAATIEAVASLANTINDIERKTAKASDELRTAIAKGPDAAAESFGKLLELSDKSAEFAGIWEGFGAEVQFGDAKVDIEEFNSAFDDLLNTAGPGAAQVVVDGLKKQNEALKGNKDQYEENARAIYDAETRIRARTDATIAATRAEREQKKAVADAVRELDIQNGTLEGAQELLKTYADNLKLVTADYDAAKAGAKAFGDEIERSTALDDQVSAATKVGTAYTSIGEIAKNLPDKLDPLMIAFGALNEEQTKAVDGFLNYGDAAQKYIQSLIEGGASPEAVKLVAQKYRDELTTQLVAAGVDPQPYLEAAGLTELQINAAIAFSVSEEERQKLTTLTTVIGDQLPPAVLNVVVADITEDDFAGANAAIALWQAVVEQDKTKIDFILGAYPDLKPVLDALTQEAAENPVPVALKPPPRKKGGLSFTAPSDFQVGSPQWVYDQIVGAWPFAKGGPIKAGTNAMVNEVGPELFVPSTNGFIMNNNDSTRLIAGVEQMLAGGGGAGGVNVGTINVTGTEPKRTASEVVRGLRSATYLMGR